MGLQEMNSKLSSQEYWDDVLKVANLPRVNSASTYLYSVTMRFIDKYIRNAGYASFFEVGCGSSGWLPYFATTYNLRVSGLDYSEIGCKLAKENLDMLGIPYGNIFCRDFFQPLPTDGKQYDIVFSYGVIEHFEKPENVLNIFSSLLNKNGLMITLVPNLNGITGKMLKYFIKDVYDMHNTISAQRLREMHEVNGLQIIKNGYAGIFALGVIPWIKSDKGLFKNGTVRRKLSLFFLKSFDKIITTLFRVMPFDFPSRSLSPYVICIARKK